MLKNIKTESVDEFVARGGKITKVTPKQAKKAFRRTMDRAKIMEQIDVQLLPEALKIKFGLR